MPITKAQMPELMEIIHQELGRDGMYKFRRIMNRFVTTAAYSRSKSFRLTIDRFLLLLGQS